MIPFWKKNKDSGKKKPPKADVPKTAQQSMHSEIRCSGTTISFGIIPTGRS